MEQKEKKVRKKRKVKNKVYSKTEQKFAKFLEAFVYNEEIKNNS